jgi:glycine cleavage system regulatory protein
MNTYIFKSLRDPDNEFSTTDVTFEVETVDRSEVIEQFIFFLKACGYNTKDLEEELGI